MTAIPEHVAAYAAALRIRLSWPEVADVVALSGLGNFHFHRLARAAEAWERSHLTPAALRRVRALGFDLRRRDLKLGLELVPRKKNTP